MGRRGIHTATILVMGVILAAVGPARAAGPPLAETSVDSGWSGSATAFAARYTANIDDSSSVALKDSSNATITGATAVEDRALLFSLPTGTELDPNDQPFTITFTAVGSGGTTTTTRTFDLDTLFPEAPVVAQPTPAISAPGFVTDIARELGADFRLHIVFPPGAPPTFSGTTRDAVLGPEDEPDTSHTSGIREIQLRFFNPLANFSTDEVFDERVVVSLGCTELCPTEAGFTAGADLGTGIWTVRVISVDLAGNESGTSRPLTFVVL